MTTTNNFGPFQYSPQCAKGMYSTAGGPSNNKGGQMGGMMPIGYDPRHYTAGYPSIPHHGHGSQAESGGGAESTPSLASFVNWGLSCLPPSMDWGAPSGD
eukprot:11562029-Karenia_brevis.AAC.1